MNKTVSRFMLILIALFLILTTACSKPYTNESHDVSFDSTEQTVIDNDINAENKNELFPDNEKGRVWQIGDKQLLERVQPFSIIINIPGYRMRI